jgi:hypothetical protein
MSNRSLRAAFFKAISTTLLTAFWLAFAAAPRAEARQGDEGCQKCGDRSVYLYDVSVLTQNPYAFPPGAVCESEPGCVERWREWVERWKSSHQVSYWYKSALRPKTDASSEDCVTFFGRMSSPLEAWVTPDLYAPTRSTELNLSFQTLPQDGPDPRPTYSSQPPNADRIDYLVYGTLTHGLQLKMTIRNFRRNEDLWYGELLFDPDDRERPVGYQGAARQVVGDSGARVANSIRQYEVSKRDEADQTGGKIAIEPKLEFAKPAYELRAAVRRRRSSSDWSTATTIP